MVNSISERCETAKYIVEGERRLSGEVKTQGAKNSALPILAATILTGDICVIENCPRLSDIEAAADILRYLGCKVEMDGNVMTVDSRELTGCSIPDNLMREMRSSIVFLGAIAARCKQASLSLPGGCELGPRPIDLHLAALRKMGVEINEEYGFLNCKVKGRIRGSNINLSIPSVGATENIMIAGALAEGITVINNAAMEPEIVDLANFLCSCGADIRGAGESRIIIDGRERLHGASHRVMPDRIAAATYMAAAAITEGDITLTNADPKSMGAVIPEFIEAGCKLEYNDDTIRLKGDGRLRAFKNVRTMPYPGFPTDALAPLMALATVAKGNSMFVETIFENRYRHVGELRRLGANIKVEGKIAVVEGVERLTGAAVRCTDLRGGAALVLAALAAKGKSEIYEISHIERGYEEFDKVIGSLGGKITRG